MEECMEDESSSTGTTSSSKSIKGCAKKRNIQHCTFCKNHKEQTPKKGHLCPYKDCSCLLCELLRKAQTTMRHQQRVWRHQKYKLQQNMKNGKFRDLTNVLDEKGQVCDKCRNHNELVMKKNHQCPYNNCKCQYCSLTFKRRELMKHLQRVRRSKLTSDIQGESIRKTEEQNFNGHSLTNEIERGEAATVKSDSSESLVNSYDNEESDISLHTDNDFDNVSLQNGSSPVLSDEIQEREIEDIGEEIISQPSPCLPLSLVMRNVDPPPLIPMASNHRAYNNYFYKLDQNVSNETNCETISDRQGPYYESLPGLYSFRKECEGMSDLKTEDLSQNHFKRFFSNSTLAPQYSNLSYASHKPIKFGVEPEDFHLRYSNWVSSSSSLDSSSLNRSFYAPFQMPQDLSKRRSDAYPSPSAIDSSAEVRYSSHNDNSNMLVSYNLALLHMTSKERDLQEFPYFRRRLTE